MHDEIKVANKVMRIATGRLSERYSDQEVQRSSATKLEEGKKEKKEKKTLGNIFAAKVAIQALKKSCRATRDNLLKERRQI